MEDYYAYLDDFDTITILIPKTMTPNVISHFTVEGNDETIALTIKSHEERDHEHKYILTFDAYILLNKRYYVHANNTFTTELYTGKIVRTKQFDSVYFYDGDDLGITYKKTHTQFKVWSPVAKSVDLILYQNGEEKHHAMSYINRGIWSVTVLGDLDNTHYLYDVFVNGKQRQVIDPYATASTANKTRSVVINKDALTPMNHPSPAFSSHAEDAIIYEMSIRDLTSDKALTIDDPITFSAACKSHVKTPKNNPAGFDYLKSLGITHVQIMPMYDFEGVDELKPFESYNWGYNPSQYFVPEGSFSTNPNAPYARINELRTLVDTYHEHGLRVVMDVVFNHVYDPDTFPLETLVPGYSYRYDDRGMLTNASGVGNDLATERAMIRKLIIDAILYWTDTFNIDGYRFDLMGLIDIDTMHAIRQKLEDVSPDVLVYGEGWKMADRPDLAHMRNKQVLFNIGFFNDLFRDTVKGSTFDDASTGFVQGNTKSLDKMMNIIQGSIAPHVLFNYPAQSINYAACHDNHTLYDKLALSLPHEDETIRHLRQELATSIVLLSQGVPFIHMGQEFFRTKHCVSNSYKSPDAINMIDWTLVDAHQDTIERFKRLISLRKTMPLLRLRSRSKIFEKTDINCNKSGTMHYTLKDEYNHYLIIFKPTMKKETLTFDRPVDILYQSSAVHQENQKYTLNSISTTIFKLA
ncbi:MAG: type I pullulanase [Bacillota bacterium]